MKNIPASMHCVLPLTCSAPTIHRGGLAAAALMLLVLSGTALGQESSVSISGALDASQSGRHRISPPQATAVTPAPEDLSKATLAPGFLLTLEIYDTPEMSATLRVDNTGSIRVPLVGPVYVKGMTLAQAQDAIAQALVAGQILTAPQVTLNIVEFATENATVLGEVQSPGRVQLLAPRPLGDVLAAVGGETVEAGDISVQHAGADGQTSTQMITRSTRQGARLLQQTMVYPGDTVTVERAGVVFILGAVTRPGGYVFVDGGSLNLLQALALAQGTTLRASVRYVDILRPNGESYNRITVPLSKMQQGHADPTVLHPKDIVYVRTSTLKAIVLDTGSLLSAAATSAVYIVR